MHISCKTKLHFCAYKNPQLGLIPSWMNKFHILEPQFFRTYSNLCTGFPTSLKCSGFLVTTSFAMLWSPLKLISIQIILVVRQTDRHTNKNLLPFTARLIKTSRSHITFKTVSENNGAEARNCTHYSSLIKMYIHIKTSYLPPNQISVMWQLDVKEVIKLQNEQNQ